MTLIEVWYVEVDGKMCGDAVFGSRADAEAATKHLPFHGIQHGLMATDDGENGFVIPYIGEGRLWRGGGKTETPGG